MPASPEVVIYTKRLCIHCVRARWLLRRRGIAFRELAAGADVAAARRALERRFGRRTFPQVVIGDRHVGGASELAVLDRGGGLAALIEGRSCSE